MIKFNKDNFSHLTNIKDLNSLNIGYKYSNLKDEKLADSLSIIEKSKLKTIEQYITNNKYFRNDFQIGSSWRRKRAGGKYQSNLWVWLVNKKDFYEVKAVPKDTPQILIPQLQVGFSFDGVSTGEIWLDKIAFRNFREIFVEVIERAKLDKTNLKLFVEFKDKTNTGKLKFTKDNLTLFKKNVLSDDAVKAGIKYFIDSNKYSGEDLSKTIMMNLIRLNEQIYSKLFSTKKIKYSKDYFKPRRRKPERKRSFNDYLRKEIGKTKVTQRHKRIQQELLEYYKNKFNHPKNAKVTKETDFIDIKVEGKTFEYLYELKTSNKPINCIKEALGQITYYLWSQDVPKNKDVKLTIIGMKDLPAGADKFFNFVKKKLDIEIEYDSVDRLLPGKEY